MYLHPGPHPGVFSDGGMEGSRVGTRTDMTEGTEGGQCILEALLKGLGGGDIHTLGLSGRSL